MKANIMFSKLKREDCFWKEVQKSIYERIKVFTGDWQDNKNSRSADVLIKWYNPNIFSTPPTLEMETGVN